MSKTGAWSAFGHIYASGWLISISQISRLLRPWYMDICLQSGGKEKRICLPCLPGCKGCRRPYKGSCFRTSHSPEEEFVVVVILGIMVAQINTRTEHTIDVSPSM